VARRLSTVQYLHGNGICYICSTVNCVVDPHPLDADPVSTYHPDADLGADPDCDFFL
jgi:hypothetical protein